MPSKRTTQTQETLAVWAADSLYLHVYTDRGKEKRGFFSKELKSADSDSFMQLLLSIQGIVGLCQASVTQQRDYILNVTITLSFGDFTFNAPQLHLDERSALVSLSEILGAIFPKEETKQKSRARRKKTPVPDCLSLPAPKLNYLEVLKARTPTGEKALYVLTKDLPALGLKKDQKVWLDFEREAKPDDLIAYSVPGDDHQYFGELQFFDFDGMLVQGGSGRMHYRSPRTVAVVVDIEDDEKWLLPKRTFYKGD